MILVYYLTILVISKIESSILIDSFNDIYFIFLLFVFTKQNVKYKCMNPLIELCEGFELFYKVGPVEYEYYYK